MDLPLTQTLGSFSADLAAAIGSQDLSASSVTLVGFGNMGRQYLKALQALQVRRLRICSRSEGPLEELKGLEGVETVAGGFERLQRRADSHELGIVSVPTDFLIPTAQRLVRLGFRHLLIEKPVSLWSDELGRLAQSFKQEGVEAACAYNRVAYPSFLELRARASEEGGITSCTYTLTERVRPDWPDRFPREELARWGIANSLHVVSMAHGLIGLPSRWSGFRSGTIPWHPSGSIFVGSGVSDQGIPFSYHADWGSTGRWSVEAQSARASYRLCPLEKLFRKTSGTGDWEELPLLSFAPEVKTGLVEQVAASLSHEIHQRIPLVDLEQAVSLTKYGEAIFGYAPQRNIP